MDINSLSGAGIAGAPQKNQALNSAGRAADKDPAAIRKVTQEFEAMFLGMMLKSMRDTVGKDKMTGGGRGDETFQSLLDQEYAATAAKSGGVGLARSLEQELTRGSQAGKVIKHEN